MRQILRAVPAHGGLISLRGGHRRWKRHDLLLLLLSFPAASCNKTDICHWAGALTGSVPVAAATAAGSLGRPQQCCRRHLLRPQRKRAGVCVQTGARTHVPGSRVTLRQRQTRAQEQPCGLRGATRPRGTSASSRTREEQLMPLAQAHALGSQSHGMLRRF